MLLFIPLMMLLAIVAGTTVYRRVRHQQGFYASRGCDDPTTDLSSDGGPPEQTFEGTPPPGRLWLDMSHAEYERMRAALGAEWEWEHGVRMRFNVDNFAEHFSTRFGDAAGFEVPKPTLAEIRDVQRVFPPPYSSGPWAKDAVSVLLPRELIVDLGEFRDLIVVEIDRIPGGTLGGPAGVVAHGIQRLLREACAGGTIADAEERLSDWYAGRRNVCRRHTGGRPRRAS